MFALIGSDAIFALPRQHRWMSHRTKAVTVSQEGRLNYHFQGCALHQRGTHIQAGFTQLSLMQKN